MALIQVIKHDEIENEIIWKYPNDELGTWTQLVVNPSQEVLLVKDGEICDIFKPGKYTLETKNIPILNKIINIPFGSESPFKAEIWFVNKRYNLDIKWGTPTPIQLEDPKYNIFIPVRSYGRFGIKIIETKLFFIKLIGTKIGLNSLEINNYLKGIYITKIKDLISNYLINKKISILEINAYIEEISSSIKEKMEKIFNEYGIELIYFNINDINISEDDLGVKRLKEALAKRAEMNIVGYNYAQERSFDTLEGVTKNNGKNQSGVLDAGVGLAMGVNLGNIFSQTLNENFSLNSSRNNEIVKECKKCGTILEEKMKFCPHCGESQVKECKKCGTILEEKMKFCPYCGNKYE